MVAGLTLKKAVQTTVESQSARCCCVITHCQAAVKDEKEKEMEKGKEKEMEKKKEKTQPQTLTESETETGAEAATQS